MKKILLISSASLFIFNIALAQNTWTQKNTFGGSARYGVVSFSIGTKAYYVTGWDATTFRKDFWQWDQATDTWTQLVDFGGVARRFAAGFAIGAKGYIGTG